MGKNRLQDFGVKLNRNKYLYLMLLPVLLYFTVFHYIPIYGVQIAFKNYFVALGIIGSPWIGFIHFRRFFNSYYFWRLLRNTIGISLYSLAIGIPSAIVLALMFNEVKQQALKRFYQTLTYAPHFLSIVVVCGLTLFFLSPTNGIINAVRTSLNLPVVNYIADRHYFWHIFVWTGVWQNVGWGTIIFTAAMSSIPQEQYEAAVIDGCRKLRRIWHITLPGIMPTIVIITILRFGQIMNVGFEKVYLLQNPLNLETSEVIATYVYKVGIVGAQFSFSAAVGLFNNIVNFFMILLVNGITRKLNETSLW